MVEPTYPKRVAAERPIDAYTVHLQLWIKADSHRGKRDLRTVQADYESIRTMGYTGGKTQVYIYCRNFKLSVDNAPRHAGFFPLSFEMSEAFQFDWSCEYAVIGGRRRRLEVAHTKLAASRAYLLLAYFTQFHEMLFDAHSRAFAAFGGIPSGVSTTTCAPLWTRWELANSVASTPGLSP